MSAPALVGNALVLHSLCYRIAIPAHTGRCMVDASLSFCHVMSVAHSASAHASQVFTWGSQPAHFQCQHRKQRLV
jgi:hypothetical protein